jgi:hypothetical protein
LAQSAKNQNKLLTIAKSVNPDIMGVGQEPPYIKPTMPDISLLVQSPPAPGQSVGTTWTQIDDQAFDNIKVEPYRTLPVGVLQLKPSDYPAVHDLVNARQLEEQLKMLHLTKLYEAVIAGSPSGAKKIEDALGVLDDEIEEIIEILNALESIYFSKSDAAGGFEPGKLFGAASTRYVQNCALMNVELGPVEQSMTFLEALSSLSSISFTTLKGMKNTAIYYQILADGDHSLRYAFSPSFYLTPGNRDDWMKPHKTGGVSYKADGFMRPQYDIRYRLSISNPSHYRSVEGVGLGDLATYSGITTRDSDMKGSATALSELSRISTLSMIQRVSRATGYLSREFMLSAGFGRMIGTPLGQSFGIGADPVNEVFGMKSVTSLYGAPNAAEPDSLADIAITDEDGNFKPDPSLGKVHILEGSHEIKDDYRTSVTQWLNTVETDPSNNDVDKFDDVFKRAISRLTEAQQLLNPVLCRDHDRDLLSPSGLYARCLTAFSNMLETITVSTETTAKKNIKTAQLVALATSGRFVSENAGLTNPGNQSWIGAKVIFSLLCRACAASIIAESEQGNTRIFGDGVPGLRWSYKESNVSWLDEWLMYTFDEKEQLAVSFSMPGASLTYDPSIDGTPYPLANEKGMHCYLYPGLKFLDCIADYETPDSPFNLISEVFRELCAEAHAAATVDDDTKTYLRIGATTEHAGFDAAIAMAHLFEVFSQMAATFLDIEIAIPPKTRELAVKMLKQPVAITPLPDPDPVKPQKNRSKPRSTGGGGGGGTKKDSTSKVGSAMGAGSGDTQQAKQQGYKSLDDPGSGQAPMEGAGQQPPPAMEPVPMPPMGPVKVLSDKQMIHQSFSSEKIGVLFRGGANEKGQTSLSKENKLRRFLNEVVSAIENKDLSVLIDSGGKVNAIPGTNATTNFASHGDCTPADIISEARKLIKEDDAPAKYFAMAKSLIEALRDQTMGFSDKAAQLRLPDIDAPPDIQLVRQFEGTDLGKKYIRGLTGVQIAHSRRRLLGFTEATEPPYVLEPTSSEVYQAIRFLIDYEDAARVGTLNSVIYMGVPAGFYDHVRIADELDLSTSTVKFEINKVDNIFSGLYYEGLVTSMPVGIYITDTDIITAMQVESPPTSLNGLVQNLLYNEGLDQISYADILARSNQPSLTATRMLNLVRSYLWKRLADITAATNFQSYKSLFLDDQSTIYSPVTPGIMQEFYQHLGLPSDFEFFNKKGQTNDLKLPGTEMYAKIIQPQKTVVDGIDGWLKPKSSQAQIDALFDLSVTKPFYIDNLRKIIFTRTVYDEIYALSYDLDSAEIEKMSPYIQSRVSSKGAASQQMIEFKLHQQAAKLEGQIEGSPNRFAIDSVYVGLNIVGQTDGMVKK